MATHIFTGHKFGQPPTDFPLDDKNRREEWAFPVPWRKIRIFDNQNSLDSELYCKLLLAIGGRSGPLTEIAPDQRGATNGPISFATRYFANVESWVPK